MSKITKNQRINQIADQLARQQGVISKLTIMVKEQNEAILMLEKLTDEKLRDQPEPQLKQLDQSVFDGLDEKWRFAAVNAAGRLMYSKTRMVHDKKYWWASSKSSDLSSGTDGYDASNWQSSLIERDIAKELTGSELCKAMLERGDKFVVCKLADTSEADAISNSTAKLVTEYDGDGFYHELADSYWYFAVPINNQSEPLTQAEAGL